MKITFIACAIAALTLSACGGGSSTPKAPTLTAAESSTVLEGSIMTNLVCTDEDSIQTADPNAANAATASNDLLNKFNKDAAKLATVMDRYITILRAKPDALYDKGSTVRDEARDVVTVNLADCKVAKSVRDRLKAELADLPPVQPS